MVKERGAKEFADFDSLLADYVKGILPPPITAFIAAHLELSPLNRRYVADLEALAGFGLNHAEPMAISNRDAKLAAIFATDLTGGKSVRAAKNRLPRTVQQFVGGDVDDLKWTTLMRGTREHKIGKFDGISASLYWINAGQALPDHTHDGGEMTLVLEGAFSDGVGHYRAGDVSMADEHLTHKPIADKDGDCIAFAITNAPLHLTGLVGLLVNPFLRAMN